MRCVTCEQFTVEGKDVFGCGEFFIRELGSIGTRADEAVKGYRVLLP